MSRISVVILTKNSGDTILRTIKDVEFADEIIIIDDFSEDDTLKQIESLKVKVFKKRLRSFSEQRNFGLEKANSDWVLFIDTDERLSNKLKNEIKNKIKRNDESGYLIRRIDYFMGKQLKHGDVSDVWILRLGKGKKGKWSGRVHEKWKIDGNVAKIGGYLKHNSHDEIKSFISKINFYSTLRARELFEDKQRASFFQVILYPFSKFLYLYFIKIGFLDGIRGLIHALIMSFYSFLVRSKLYLFNK